MSFMITPNIDAAYSMTHEDLFVADHKSSDVTMFNYEFEDNGSIDSITGSNLKPQNDSLTDGLSAYKQKPPMPFST